MIIVVNQDSMIQDDICILFMRHFYMQLLAGRTVEQSFIEAQSTVRASQLCYKSCCCAHSHTQKCQWYQYAKKEGFEKAHLLHSGTCKCGLKGNKHKNTCQVLRDFKKFWSQKSKEHQEVQVDQGNNIMDSFFN